MDTTTTVTEEQLPTFVETENGKVSFDLDYQVGDLVALLLDEAGFYTMMKIDRSQDHSTEHYLDVLKRWIASITVTTLQIVDVGELLFDDSNELTRYLYIDDNLLAVVTTYPLPDEVGTHIPLYTRANPNIRWYMHIAHQSVLNKTLYTEGFATPIACAFLNARSQTSRV